MENVAKTNRMGSEKIPTLLLKMALPMMFSMVVSALYNIVDSIFIGMMEAPFNEKAITALGYAYPLQTLLVAVAIGTGIGVNSVLSKALGEGKGDKAARSCINGYLLMIFFYVIFLAFGLAVFSMLLFYNFISISINNKKREIGILRAVGAKRADVFKIFYSEACIIALVNFLLSVICTFALSFIMNLELANSGLITFAVMNPNIVVVLAIFGVALVAAFISSFLPVIRLANKKPIDAIQNR